MNFRTSLAHWWSRFRENPPGRRFQELHRRRKAGRKGSFDASRLLLMGGGLGLIAVGLIFLATPGPGLLLLVAGLGMLASESLLIARFLDGADLKTRPFLLRLAARWKRLKQPRKPPAPQPPV